MVRNKVNYKMQFPDNACIPEITNHSCFFPIWIHLFPLPIITWWRHKMNALPWRHNGHDSVSNHQPHDCLLNRLFRRRSKKTSKLRVTGLCVGNSPGPVNSPHKGPVTRKMFPFDDVIMWTHSALLTLGLGKPLVTAPHSSNKAVL